MFSKGPNTTRPQRRQAASPAIDQLRGHQPLAPPAERRILLDPVGINIKIVVESTREFISLRGPSEPSNYLPADEVVDPVKQKLILDEMRREVDALVLRYGHLEEFWKLLAAALPTAV